MVLQCMCRSMSVHICVQFLYYVINNTTLTIMSHGAAHNAVRSGSRNSCAVHTTPQMVRNVFLAIWIEML